MKDFFAAALLAGSLLIQSFATQPVPLQKGVVLYAHNTGRNCVFTVRLKDKSTLTMPGPCAMQPGDSVVVLMKALK